VRTNAWPRRSGTSEYPRKDHLLDLASDCEAKAERLYTERKYADAAQLKKLAAIYADMAKEEQA
jgi:hypothetical protein